MKKEKVKKEINESLIRPATLDDRRIWAHGALRYRAKIDSYYYEMNKDGKVYVLEANGSGAKLTGVIDTPDKETLAAVIASDHWTDRKVVIQRIADTYPAD